MRAWLRPPRSLLVILFLLTLVSLSAVAWFGWRLLEQDSVVEQQQKQERLEQTADRIVVTLRGILAETGERLSEGTAGVGPVFVLTANRLTPLPPTRLLYRSFPATEPEAAAEVFAGGESLEFQQGQPEAAADWYRRMAGSQDAAIRAAALVRLGRVLRKLGRLEESRAAYEQLAAIEGVRVAGEPADLVGRIALGEKEGVKEGLLGGRWPLSRGQFEYYWSQVSREPAPVMSAELEQAAELAWQERLREPVARGQATVWVQGHPWFIMWRGDAARRAMLVTTPESVVNESLAGDEVGFAAVDGEGRVVAGSKDGVGRSVVRTAADSQLPWTMYVKSAKGYKDAGMVVRQRFVLFGMAVMVVFLVACTYFIARAIQRENAVSRLQSDFVSAVSHEFRSPLTSMRQLSEILAFGRVPNEERRQRYYETLVSETERLQRLVEKLLNFGGIEAGKRQYHFEPLDTAPLVEHVAKSNSSRRSRDRDG